MNCMLQQWTITAHVTVDAVKIQSNVLTPSDSSDSKPAQPAVADKHKHACPPVLLVQTTETSCGECHGYTGHKNRFHTTALCASTVSPRANSCQQPLLSDEGLDAWLDDSMSCCALDLHKQASASLAVQHRHIYRKASSYHQSTHFPSQRCSGFCVSVESQTNLHLMLSCLRNPQGCLVALLPTWTPHSLMGDVVPVHSCT
jgi:hypothetical protein